MLDSMLTTSQFERVSAIAKRRWGLSFNSSKMQLVTSRLASFLRKSSSFQDVGEYLDYLEGAPSEQDLLDFFDLLSTNVTSFFRDRAHFDYLERELFTGIARGNLTLPNRELRMWSAGCSTGCEPFTMAMLAHEHLSRQSGWTTRILATDLSNYAVGEARRGVYTAQELKDVPRELRDRHFEARDGAFVVRAHLRAMVSVARLNLMDPWAMKGKFDVIFCRNVMIYFDGPTRTRLVHRFVSMLRPGGIFAVGSAETLAGMDVGMRAVMPSMYVK